ncbi:MAG: hypothetical protein RL095_2322 [Verrucomicrobiota bacterium]|jgi:hypothetical protein
MRFFFLQIPLSLLLFSSCDGPQQAPEVVISTEGEPEAASGEKSWCRKPENPADQRWLDAAKPLVEALIANDMAAFYGGLSPHAKARICLSQFDPPENDQEEAERSKVVIQNATQMQFIEMFAKTWKRFGRPLQAVDFDIGTTDPKVLRWEADGLDRIECVFNVGAIPESVPKDLRKASVLGHFLYSLPERELPSLAEKYGMTLEELKKRIAEDPPRFKFKMVFLEDAGKISLGYFEFNPMGLMD